jgi:hypothetical protein
MLKALMRGGDATWGPFTFTGDELALRLPVLIVAAATVKALASFVHSGLSGTVAQRVLSHAHQPVLVVRG